MSKKIFFYPQIFACKKVFCLCWCSPKNITPLLDVVSGKVAGQTPTASTIGNQREAYLLLIFKKL
jgi:hypothetical protein